MPAVCCVNGQPPICAGPCHKLPSYPAAPAAQSSLDYVVAMELWWRTAALQALSAVVAGPLAAAPRADQPRMYQRGAALLKPTLDVLAAHAALQVGWQGAGR